MSKPKFPLIYADPTIQARYVQLRKQGQSDAMAQMLAEQRPPGTKGTDRAFLQDRNGGQDIEAMTAPVRKRLLENAAKAGVSVQNKRYISQLARRGVPCDPLALVSDMGDVKARALAMGRYVNSEGHEAPPPKSVPLAEDLVQDEIARRIKKDPGLKKVPKQTMREQVIDECAFKRKPRT